MPNTNEQPERRGLVDRARTAWNNLTARVRPAEGNQPSSTDSETVISYKDTGLQMAELHRILQLTEEERENPQRRNQQRLEYQADLARSTYAAYQEIKSEIDQGRIRPDSYNTMDTEYSNAVNAVLSVINFLIEAMKIEFQTERNAISRLEESKENQQKLEQWRQKVYEAEATARERIAQFNLPPEVLGSEKVENRIRIGFTADIRAAVL